MPISHVENIDCMLGMRNYPDKYFELAVVDPPYGQGNSDATKTFTSNSINRAAKRTFYKQFENTLRPSQEYFSELKRVSKNQIVWGGNFFGLEGGYICWNKNGTAFGEAELAYCSMQKSVSVYECTWNGMIQHDMLNKEERIHPTQKPVKLYKWLLKNYAKEGDKILDSHMGSQSSRIAAWLMGFDFVGYEIDFDYYTSGCKRFEEQTKQQVLFPYER